MILKTHPDNPNIRHIRRAIEALEAGGLIAYATDTVYGLGCDIHNKQAMERALALKGYSKEHALSFLCADLSDISKYARVSTPAYKIMKHCVPGRVHVYSARLARSAQTAARPSGRRWASACPTMPSAARCSRNSGGPILSTSVTSRTGELLTDPDEIEAEWRHEIAVVLDTGPLQSALSTVVDLTDDAAGPVIVRAGKGDLALIG